MSKLVNLLLGRRIKHIDDGWVILTNWSDEAWLNRSGTYSFRSTACKRTYCIFKSQQDAEKVFIKAYGSGIINASRK